MRAACFKFSEDLCTPNKLHSHRADCSARATGAQEKPWLSGKDSSSEGDSSGVLSSDFSRLGTGDPVAHHECFTVQHSHSVDVGIEMAIICHVNNKHFQLTEWL